MDDIVVSVMMLTYQHENYISKAIDSVMMQKVNFKYELIIIDDFSRDDTRKIICKYKKLYPNKIKLILRKKNVGPTKSFYFALRYAEGKYIAYLEGDDYWKDELKLIRQVSFLEENNQFIGVFHRCSFIDENEGIVKNRYNDLYSNKSIYNLIDFEKDRLPGHTSTLVCRNIFQNNREKYSFIYKIHFYIGDQSLYVLLLTMGDLFIFKEKMSVYRIVTDKSATSCASRSANNNLTYENWKYYNELERNIKKVTKIEINLKKNKIIQYQAALYLLKNEFSFKNLNIFCKIAFHNLIMNKIAKN